MGFMRRPRKVHIDLFGITYILCLNWPTADFCKWYSKKYNHPIHTTGEQALTVPHLEESEIVIWNGTKSTTNLVHECTHAANYTLHHIGHKADFENDEVQAHLIDWIFNKAKGG